MGLIQTGAVFERKGLATTSSQPRYALRKSFADLFAARKAQFDSLVQQWRQDHLSHGALARLALVQQGLGKAESDRQVSVAFPNGSVRRMSPGPSSLITKAVIEEFATRFLEDPGVLFVSESRRKVVLSDQALSQSIGLDIDAQRVLPDIILVDMAPSTPLLAFVEVVATDGPVSESRRSDLMQIARGAGFEECDATFVTALLDRSERGVFKKISADIAWGSFVWFASEPEHLISYSAPFPAMCYLHQLCRL